MAKAKANKRTTKANTDTANIKPANDEFLIVGLGASAGGIHAFKEFFQHMPPKSGIAFVVILHLSPDHDSKLAQVIQTTTQMPVSQVMEKVAVVPDHVYVVPPNQHLTMQDGSIIVSPNTQIEDRRAPVDIFFRTLAEEHGSRAIAIILSGTGANGSMGIKRIKEKGGVAFVQNPREAEFNEMPRNSIATGLVDEVLNVAELPAKIIAYKNSLGKVLISEEPESRPQDQQQALREIFTEIRVRTGHDFSNYKRPTLLRRIERRINIHSLPDLPSYVAFMHENKEETHALLKDLLISVTNFFRDKKAFDIIEKELLPLVLKGKTAENQLRIWVAGCATGEEAYSIAILCAELTSGLIDGPKVQIFATDIDEAAIAHAREGLYTLNDVADVSPERLRRFFIKEGDSYRIRREVREMVMFAFHNFLKDPPFSHLDLISCRNVMIYLNHVAQERVTETFHFALNPGGYLFLGSSESVDGATDLYAAYNRENHIFQSRRVSQRIYPIPETVPNVHVAKPRSSLALDHESKTQERFSFGDLHQQLLEQYAPPSLVVNEEYDIVHISERAGKYLQISGGELSRNLLKLINPDLRLETRSALYQAVQHHSAVESRGVKVKLGDRTENINIHVRPVLRPGDTARGFLLVLFEPTTMEKEEVDVLLTSNEPVSKLLEEELTKLKSQLRSSNEQHEYQAEELKASNEELQAMNEELRSATEELETSKEELQSINEELRTVNQELKVKIEEATLTNNNLQNLINSTDIGTIFLDRSLRVVLFTPAARKIFNLIAADFGRPLTDITGQLEYDNLLHDAETVLDKLTTFEQEVRTIENGFYLMRISPYRTSEDRINGVVITFVDITARKKAEQELQENIDELKRFNQAMVSRESRMIELKKEVNDVTKRLGEQPRYPLDFEKEEKTNHAPNQ
jgi:two-component system, chemotaxis family, CheB/CheR fusion protein